MLQLNNKGIATFIVTIIMTVLLLIANLLIYIVEEDRLMVNDYEDRKQAFYIAEAAADLAINRWVDFINDQHEPNPRETEVPSPVTITGENGYEIYIDDEKETLVDNLITSTGVKEVSVDYYLDGYNDMGKLYCVEKDPASDYNTLNIRVDATYKKTIYIYSVRLSYCYHGKVFTYKGEGSYQ